MVQLRDDNGSDVSLWGGSGGVLRNGRDILKDVLTQIADGLMWEEILKRNHDYSQRFAGWTNVWMVGGAIYWDWGKMEEGVGKQEFCSACDM